jgi:hypothetical protein
LVFLNAMIIHNTVHVTADILDILVGFIAASIAIF